MHSPVHTPHSPRATLRRTGAVPTASPGRAPPEPSTALRSAPSPGVCTRSAANSASYSSTTLPSLQGNPRRVQGWLGPPGPALHPGTAMAPRHDVPRAPPRQGALHAAGLRKHLPDPRHLQPQEPRHGHEEGRDLCREEAEREAGWPPAAAPPGQPCPALTVRLKLCSRPQRSRDPGSCRAGTNPMSSTSSQGMRRRDAAGEETGISTTGIRTACPGRPPLLIPPQADGSSELYLPLCPGRVSQIPQTHLSGGVADPPQ